MAWASPTILDKMPDESPKAYWKRARQQHNDFAEKFNKDFFNKHIYRKKIELMPTYNQMMKKYKKEIKQ